MSKPVGVSYADRKATIKCGDVIVYSATRFTSVLSIFTWIIRLFTLSEYNHVGIAWVIGGRYFIIEAALPEVKISPLSHHGSFYHIPMDISFGDKETDILMAKVGEKYSRIEAILSYFHSSNENDKKWVCVELVQYFFDAIGLDIGKNYTPSDLVSSLTKVLGKEMRYVKI